MAAASTAADVPLGSSLIANGGPDTSAWNMFWILHPMICGCGLVNPVKMMPRLCDDDMKVLCAGCVGLCDVGTKDGTCKWSGADPTQCVLCEGKNYCVKGEQSLYCGSCCEESTGVCCRTQANCFCKKEQKEAGAQAENKFCCVKQQLTCNLETPCEKDTGICVKQSCRMCCCFAQRNIKLVSVGGDQGFISCVWRSCFCVDICQIPPKNMFCEIVGMRLMGPTEKNREVFPAGEGDTPQKVVASAANFGRADTEWVLKRLLTKLDVLIHSLNRTHPADLRLPF